MLPEAKHENLIYTSDMNVRKVFVLSLHSGKLVGTLSFSRTPWGLCSDRAGDVFVTRYAGHAKRGVVTEFPHGGTKAIVQRQVAPGVGACAIDSSTGDLAVSTNNGNSPPQISVYSPPYDGPPIRTIVTATWGLVLYLTYDAAGSLYFATISGSEGNHLLKLAKNSNTPVQIKHLTSRDASGSPAGWHGKDLVFAPGGGDDAIEHIRISQHRGRVVGVTTLAGSGLNFGGNQACVDGSVFAAPFWYDPTHDTEVIGIWAYPSGKQMAAFGGFGESFLEGITISRARTAR